MGFASQNETAVVGVIMKAGDTLVQVSQAAKEFGLLCQELKQVLVVFRPQIKDMADDYYKKKWEEERKGE